MLYFICSSYECFILRVRRLFGKLPKQGYAVERLKLSFRKFYVRYGDHIQQYEVSLSRMLNYILHLVGCWSSVSIRRITYKFLNVCPFDYTVVAVNGKVERLLTGLNTPVGWLLLLQLTVLIGKQSNYCHVAFWIFLWVKGFLSQDWVRSLPFSLILTLDQ